MMINETVHILKLSNILLFGITHFPFRQTYASQCIHFLRLLTVLCLKNQMLKEVFILALISSPASL